MRPFPWTVTLVATTTTVDRKAFLAFVDSLRALESEQLGVDCCPTAGRRTSFRRACGTCAGTPGG